MATIQGVYLALFGRPADPLGLSFFNTATGNGADLTAIGDLTATAEYQARFAGQSTTQIITSIYQSLFNREPDLAGLTYFANALANKTLTVNNIAIAIYDGAQGADKTVLALKEAAANAFTAAIDTVAEINGYTGSTALSAASAFIAGVKTTAPDAAAVTAAVAAATTGGSGTNGLNKALTATADVFVDGTANSDTYYGFINTTALSTDSTFAAVDVIDAKGGVDSLNVTVVGSAALTALPAASISNVEKLYIRDLNSGGQSTIDVSSITGLTEVWNDRSTQAVDFVGLAAGTVIGVKGDGTNANGQNDATFAGTTAKTAAIVLDSVKGINGSFAVSNTSIETVTISSIGSANERSSLTLAGSGAALKTLTIDASSNLTSDLATADYVTTGADLVVKGSATAVKLGSGGVFKTIDASAFAGGLTVATNAVTTSVKGGAGNDVIKYAGSTSTATIALGAGDDRLTGTFASPLASGISVDGGAGTDTINSDAISLSNAAKFLNFEVLELGTTGLDVNALTGSTLTKLVLAGAGGGTFNNVATGVGLEVTSTTAAGTTTINVKDAATTAADTFAVTFAGAAQTAATTVAAGTVVLNGIEAVTIASGGGANNANTITLTDDKLKTVTITGDKDLSLAFAGTNGTNTAAAAGGAVNLIDGSAATGKLTINTTNVTADDKSGVGLTVKGGSAADTLTITLAATVDSGAGNDVITLSKKATVTAGAGDDTVTVSSEGGTITGGDGKDTVSVKAAVYSASKVITTITDFVAGTDKLTLLDKGTEVFTATVFDKGTAGTLTEVLDLIAAGDGSTHGIVKWFQFSGDTYIVEDVSAATTLDAADIVVKLTGTVDLSALTVAGFNFAA